MEERIITVNDHRRIWTDTSESLRPFRDDMFRNINYVNGIQYTSEDLRYLAHHKRLPVIWNIILPKILAFTGAERSNRIMARAEAVENSDIIMANLINLLLEQDNEETRANWNISLAAMHAAIFRYGALMCNWEKTNKYPEGQYTLKAVDPRDVWFDPHPSEMDFDNSNYIIYSRWYTPEHIIQKYISDPKEAAELESIAARLEGIHSGKLKDKTYAERYKTFTNILVERDRNRSSEDRGVTDFSDYIYNGMYRVVELHQKEKTDVLYIIDPLRGESVRIPDKLNKNAEFIGGILKSRGLDPRAESWQKQDLMTISASAPGLTDKMLYNRPYAVQGAGYMIKILPGYNLDPDRRNLRAIVDVLIDPQDLVNRDLSSRALMMNKLLNPDIYLGPTAIDDEEQKNQLKSQQSGKIVQMNNIRDMIIKYPEIGGMNMFTQSARDAQAMSEETPGISKNMMGMKEHSDESGKLVQVRAGLSEAMLTLLFDNVSNTVISVEKMHLALIQHHMTLKRMVRTVGPSGDVEYAGEVNKYDPVLNVFKNDITVGKFDIKIDKTKYTRTERQLQLDKLIQVLNLADPESRIDIYPSIYELFDTPQGKQLKARAEQRSELMALRRQLEVLQTIQGIKSVQAALNLQPEVDQLQEISIQTQKLNATLQQQQLQGAMQAQVAQQELQSGEFTEDQAKQEISNLQTEGPSI